MVAVGCFTGNFSRGKIEPLHEKLHFISVLHCDSGVVGRRSKLCLPKTLPKICV